MRPRLLDLFCGAGGASVGYHRAGFDVVGVDIAPQPNYPSGFGFHQRGALEFLELYGHKFDVIHASPPCQKFSSITRTAGTVTCHANLVGPVRELLKAIGKPYVIENVPGAPLENPLLLCGTMFGLKVVRHRLFETSPTIYFPPQDCQHERKRAKCGRPVDREKNYITVVGNFSDIGFAREAMGIDWMGQKELAQAIPPAYTEWIGRQLWWRHRKIA